MSKKKFSKRPGGLFLIMLLVLGISLVFSGCGNQAMPEENNSQQNQETGSEDNNGSSNNTQQESITLTFAHHNATETVQAIYMEKWAEMVHEETNGQVTINIHPASQMGDQREILESVKLGNVDMGLGDHAYLSNLIPEYGLFDLPFIFRDYDHIEKVLDSSLTEPLNEQLIEEHNMRHLGWMHIGYRAVLSTTDINGYDDFEGLSIRSPETRVYMETFERIGANPTPVPWGEVYTAMETGLVEAMETVPEALYAQQFYEIGETVAATNHIQTAIGPVINEELWQSLPEEVKEVLLSTLETIIEEEREETILLNEKAYEAMENEGVKVVYFSDEDMQNFRNDVQPFWDEFASELGAEDLLQQIIDTE